MRSGRRRRGDNNRAGTGGKLGLTLFFMFFFLMGSFFEVMIAREFMTRLKQRTWRSTPCTIHSSRAAETQDTDNPYAFRVRFEYQVQGQSRQSETYATHYRGSDSYDKTARLARRYPPGSQQRCYVNPRQPAQAALARGSLWFGLVLLFPLIFVLIGLGGMVGTWWPDRKKENKTRRISISRKRGPAVAAVFFAIFALVGAGVLVPLFILPAVRILDARDWVSVPCRVLRSEVRSHDSDDGTTYSVHILYEYEHQGQTYRTDRYSFLGGSSSGYRGKRQIVDRYPVGSEARCWMDPEDPTEAVLFRRFSPMMWFGLIPGVFILVGVGGMAGTLRRVRKRSAGPLQAEWLPAAAHETDAPAWGQPSDNTAGSVTLKPACGMFGKFLGVLIFGLIWNAIVTFMVMTRLPNGPASPVPLLMVVIFALIGAALLAAIVYQFMALFNPRPRIQLSAGYVPLGDRITVDWTLSGAVGRIQKLSLTLTGQESAKYRRGTSTYTARRSFHKEELAVCTDPLAMRQGRAELAIPAQSMHSLQGENNCITWSLVLHGDIPRWPDVKESFEITVTPMKPAVIAQQIVSTAEDVPWAIPVAGEKETVQ
jgi:hypothetical protein